MVRGRWYILGAGSIGCLWGAHLAAAGKPVTLLLRDARTARELREAGGIELEEAGSTRQIPVAGEVASADGDPLYQVLVTVKAHHTIDALESLGQRIGADTRLVLLQNGMGVAEKILAGWPDMAVLVGSTTEGVWRPKRFRVCHAGHGRTWIGPYARPHGEQEGKRVVASLQTGTLDLSWDHDIKTRLWNKLAVNCAINPLTALARCRNGDLAALSMGHRLMAGVCEEVQSVLEAEAVPLLQPVLDTVLEVVAATADNRSSMLQDIEAGRTTEIDWINGYLEQRARKLGVETPLNRILLDLMHLAEGCRDTVKKSS